MAKTTENPSSSHRRFNMTSDTTPLEPAYCSCTTTNPLHCEYAGYVGQVEPCVCDCHPETDGDGDAWKYNPEEDTYSASHGHVG